MSNRERVGKGLVLLAPGLRSFVEREAKSHLGEDWHSALLDAGNRSPIGTMQRRKPRIPNLDDPAVLLAVLWNQWNLVFRDVLGHPERSLVSELRDVRNRWAHNEQFSTDDAIRALDSMERLLNAVSAGDAAGQVGQMRMELMRTLFIFDQYCEERGDGDILDERLIARLCEDSPEVSNHVRELISDAKAGEELLRPLKDPLISTLHETHPRLPDGTTLVELCGAGGYGCVYRAVQGAGDDKQRDVAVKFFPHGMFQKESFDREVKALQKLSNAPNVPTLYTWDEHVGYWYFASEWIPGVSLDAEIATRRRKKALFSPGEIQAIVGGILTVMQNVHAEYDKNTEHDHNGVVVPAFVHCDLKPANVMLKNSYVKEPSDVWLVDFGVAQAGAAISGFTEAYASPEMLTPPPAGTARTIGTASDIFQVGLIGFELATGTPYWDTPAHERGASLRRAAIPAGLRAAIQRALEWEPRRRFAGPAEFWCELHRSAPFRLALGAWRSATALRVAFVLVLTLSSVGALAAWHYYARHGQLRSERDGLATRCDELKSDNSQLRDELARRTAPLDAIQRYRGLSDRFNALYKDPRKVADSKWRSAMREDLEAYLKQFPVDARHVDDLRRAITWLKRVDRPITVTIQPVSLEEFAWMRSAMVGFKVFHGSQELLYYKPTSVDGKMDLSAENPLLISWQPGEEIEIQLFDSSSCIERMFLAQDLLNRLIAGTLADAAAVYITKGNQKAWFRISAPDPPEQPPLLP